MNPKFCQHLIGVWSYKYEGFALLYEGENFPPDADDREIFNFCPFCGSRLPPYESLDLPMSKTTN